MSERPLKVLVIEADPVSGKLVERTLSVEKTRPFETVWVQSLAGALSRLETESFSVVVLDLNLPDSSGIATFHRVSEAAMDAAIVLLTGTAEEALAHEAIQSGAQDFLVKGAMDTSSSSVPSATPTSDARGARPRSSKTSSSTMSATSCARP